jgi:very-short-patch-repair endonuclease
MTRLQQSFLPPARSNSRFEDLFAFHCRAFKLPEPEEQYRFALPLKREFRADFAWPKYRLLVEVQGGIWRRGGGAHSHPSNLERDVVKQQHAALLGYIVLPITTDEVKSGKGIELAMRVLISRGWQPP